MTTFVQKNAGVAKTKKKAAKPTLCAPYNTHWAPVDKKNEEEIFAILEKTLTSVNLKLPVVDRHLKKEERAKARDEQLQQRTAQEKNLSTQLVRGANAVTRCAEKDGLRLCVVDRGAPWQLHKHLIQLCALRGCTAVALTGLAARAQGWLGITTCAVLGFKKPKADDDAHFTEAVSRISALVPESQPLPWLLTEMTPSESESDDESDDESDEESDEESDKESNNKNESNEVENADTKAQNTAAKTETDTASDTKENTAEPTKPLAFNSQAFISFGETQESAKKVTIKTGIMDLLESEDKYNKVPSKKNTKKRKRGKKPGVRKGKYETANVGQVVANPNKKRKK